MANVTIFEEGSVEEKNADVAMGFEKAVVVALQGVESAELTDIVLEELPRFLKLFFAKNREYGENAQTLGSKGQFADIWRKIGKLKVGLWDGHEERLTSEGVDEILRDLIGHCFLTLRIRSQERQQERYEVDGFRAAPSKTRSRMQDSGIAGDPDADFTLDI
jgi:hypothetical protein